MLAPSATSRGLKNAAGDFTPAAAAPVRLAIVTNIPAPYRVPVYNLVAATPGVELHVFYGAEREPDREWTLPPLTHQHTFMRGRRYDRRGRFIHDNSEVYDLLGSMQPDVVLTTGFNPTHLYAFAWAWRHRRRHVAMTDGTVNSEAGISKLHRLVRRVVFARSQAFVAASAGGRRLFESYGVHGERIFISPLCANSTVDWSVSLPTAAAQIDLLFSGRFVAVKNPSFFLAVARGVAQRLGRRVRVALLGGGPLEHGVRAEAAAMADLVDAQFTGQVAQAELPAWYARSRLFLFPTSWDPWGVVVNEACMAGVPVVVSPHAGAAGELIVDGVSGRVLPLDVESWIAAAADILADAELRERMSAAARQAVAPYSFANAAGGIVDAARRAAMPRVLCVQRRLTHYRVPLFERIRERLTAAGVWFELAYGDPTAEEAAKHDEGRLDWGAHVPCRYFFGGRLCWQNTIRAARTADLVIITQENKLLYNLYAQLIQRPRRLAFWGHGRNFQALGANRLREAFKRRVSVHADWWFAYTGLSRRLVNEMGFPNSRITNLENSIDTTTFAEQCEAVTTADVAAFREHWKLGEGPLGVFVGSLYADKRVEFLLQAGAALAARLPGFHLIVIGDGPQRPLVESTARRAPWLRYEGVKYGNEKAVCMRSAQIVLNPGLVGLGILDAFAAALPLITTDSKLHSPEIDYLRNGENGIMTTDSLDAYVDACARLLADPEERARMGRAARLDAAHYTLDNMAAHFCEGVLAALRIPAR